MVVLAHDVAPCTTGDGVMYHLGSRSRNFLTSFAMGESGSESAGSSIMIRATIATACSRSFSDGSSRGNALSAASGSSCISSACSATTECRSASEIAGWPFRCSVISCAIRNERRSMAPRFLITAINIRTTASRKPPRSNSPRRAASSAFACCSALFSAFGSRGGSGGKKAPRPIGP